MKYVEALESLIKGLGSNALPPAGRLSGKELQASGERADAWVAFDEDDSLHLLFPSMPESKTQFQRLVKFKQRFLAFGVKKWIVSGQDAQEYLDICCIADRKSEYRKPFIYFASDCLAELEAEASDPAAAIYRVAQRWHRFWVLSAEQDITSEWIKGLLGELWLLYDLVKSFGSGAVRSWTGPMGHDQDFQANGIALEVKTTETLPPVLKISNLDQLDHTLFKALWVVVHSVTERDDGVGLPDVVALLEKTIEEPVLQEHFWKSLAESGYRRHLELQYREHLYRRGKTQFYQVKAVFPVLTHRSLKKSLDKRIQSIRYSVKLSGIVPSVAKDFSVQKSLKALCNG